MVWALAGVAATPLGWPAGAHAQSAPPAAQQPIPSTDGPTDEQIVAALKERLRQEMLQSIAAEYGNLDRLSGEALGTLRGMAPASAPGILACTLNSPVEQRRCIERLKGQLIAERAARVKEARSPDFGDALVYSVQEKHNYEGNYIAYVNTRKRGTDTAWRIKLLLQFRNGAWVATEKSEKKVS